MFDDRTPIYRQIADQIREDVVSGALAEEQQVMSTNQYAAFHRINPATAAKAFQELVDEGVLYKRRGVGMFVAPGATERLRAERRSGFVERVVVPLVREAVRLDLPADDVVASVRDELARARAGR
jgi:DNA-binding transcriptional regulator YhcF (GntR family)